MFTRSFIRRNKVAIAAAAGFAVGAFMYLNSNLRPVPAEVKLDLPLRETKNNPQLSTTDLRSKQALEDVDFKGKRVLMRVDYNVPVTDGVVTDTARIDATIESLRYIISKRPKCISLIAHLKRPGFNYKRSDYTLEPCVDVLKSKFPSQKIRFLPDCVGPEVKKAIDECEDGTIFLLENLRFHIEETGSGVDAKGEKVKADPEKVKEFRQALSSLGDVFVFEAFGAAHRPHSSIVGIDIPQRVAGKLMHKELQTYGQIFADPERPFLAIIGGSKVSDKIKVIGNLLDNVDEMIIGGGMAYTFKKQLDGVQIGKSLFDEKGKNMVEDIMKKAAERGVKIHLPTDHVIADRFSCDAGTKIGITTDSEGVPDEWLALDIGPESRAHFSQVMSKAKTILWNGPLGAYELSAFAGGTLSAMYDMVRSKQAGNTTIIGGGDTGAASASLYYGSSPIAEQVTHVSTGGGSSLVLMEGKSLPAVDALSDINDGTSIRFTKKK